MNNFNFDEHAGEGLMLLAYGALNDWSGMCR